METSPKGIIFFKPKWLLVSIDQHKEPYMDTINIPLQFLAKET